nr:DUF3426 domain-containing protein [Desulfobacterales bacterium]
GLAAGAGMAAMLGEDEKTPAEPAGAENAKTAAAGPPELKLGFDEPLSPEEGQDDAELVTDEINLGELDLLLDDGPLPSGPEPDDDFKTEELDLADLEKMLDGDVDEISAPAQSPATSALDDLDAAQEETEESIIEDLDLDMEDFESLLDEDTDLGDWLETPASTGVAGAAVEDFSLDADDDVKLELAPELEDLLEDDSRDFDIEETAEIGLPEVEDTAAGPEIEERPEVSFDDDDINLELAPGLDSLFDEAEDSDVPLEETEELDFSDLEDDLGQPDQGLEGSAQEPEALDLDLELGPDQETGLDGPSLTPDDEFEMALPVNDESESKPAEAAEGVEELDLGDLESALEGEAAQPARLSPGEEEPELVLELEGDSNEPTDVDDFNLALDDLDFETSDQAEEGEIEETRELDLDDLESLLDDSEAPADAAPRLDAEDLELDLDLDEAMAEGTDNLDDATRELNLDDIEKILELPESTPATSTDEAEADDLELDLDIGDEPEVSEAADEVLLDGDETTAGSDSLDLSELEKMLDVEDTTDSPTLPADEAVDDLDLDFELQPANDDEEELDLEFDMLGDESEEASALFDTSESEDLGLDLDIAETPEPEKVELEEDLDFVIMDDDGGDELDLDILEDDAAPETVTAPIETAALGAGGAMASRDLTQELMDEMAAADTQTMDIPPTESRPIKPPPIPTKKKSSKSLVLLFLLILLGAGGYFVYNKTGFDFSKLNLSDLPEIPYVSQWLGGKKALEAVVPVETTLKGSWVQNKTDGRIYIIQGRVKNEYSQPRSFIRVTGSIFADGRKFKRVVQAYCGNMPSLQDLENLPVADLQKRLVNRNGTNNVNVKVAPGKEVPFTVIFAGLPEDVELQEYAVEISGSLPATDAKSK